MVINHQWINWHIATTCYLRLLFFFLLKWIWRYIKDFTSSRQCRIRVEQRWPGQSIANAWGHKRPRTGRADQVWRSRGSVCHRELVCWDPPVPELQNSHRVVHDFISKQFMHILNKLYKKYMCIVFLFRKFIQYW